MMATDRKKRTEFGDFQTPLDLAREVCSLISSSGFEPASIVEPTCGRGSFLQAALDAFPTAKQVLGFDRNPEYVQAAQATVQAVSGPQVEVCKADFFEIDWSRIVDSLRAPILIIGNPPWVTNAAMRSLGGRNLPRKANVDSLRGIDALTGKSNFDISEWMLRENVRWLTRRHGMLAVLCKTAVARKIVAFAWSNGVPIQSASLYRLDANAHFGASVDACVLVIRTCPGCTTQECTEYRSLKAVQPSSVFSFRQGELVADVGLYERWSHLHRPGLRGWRSGIKHDCSKVFELDTHDGVFINGLGERVEIEPQVVFSLLKSSDLAAHRGPRKWLLVPQRSMSDSPERLQVSAPKAWRYLGEHAEALDKRASSIYKKRPRFSIFGVGPYSFSPWKVAISGLYKTIDFVPVGPANGRAVMLDDTCYFFPCASEEECKLLHQLVTSQPAKEFWSAFVFWDAKRPITAKLLNSLDLAVLAQELGMLFETTRILAERQLVDYTGRAHQRLLFRESAPSYG